jgi:hypothetical protein
MKIYPRFKHHAKDKKSILVTSAEHEKELGHGWTERRDGILEEGEEGYVETTDQESEVELPSESLDSDTSLPPEPEKESKPKKIFGKGKK